MKKSISIKAVILSLVELATPRTTTSLNGVKRVLTHRLHLEKSPSLLEANKIAESLERDQSLTNGDRKASIASIAPTFASIDIDRNVLVTQLGKCGVKGNLLPLVIQGATFTATAQFREIGDVVTNRRNGEEIEIEQSHAVLEDMNVELTPQQKFLAGSMMSVDISSLFTTVPPVSITDSGNTSETKTETKISVKRKEGEKPEVFAKRVADRKAALALENKLDLDNFIIADLSGNEITDYAGVEEVIIATA